MTQAAPLTQEERERYSRHLLLPGFGEAAQVRLKQAKVLVIGAGGLGSPALLYLTAAGIGHLTLVDADTVSESNLQRQVLYTCADIGLPKVRCAQRRLQALNPQLEVRALEERFTEHNADALCAHADLVVDCSDNYATRYLSNDACLRTGRPLVFAAICNYTGQLSVFNHRGGPDYRSLFPEPPATTDTPDPTLLGVLGALPGLLGTLQAMEAIKVLTGVGTPASGVLLTWDARTLKMEKIVFGAPMGVSGRNV